MNELKPSFLEELYSRLSEGKTGGRFTPGLNHFTGKLNRQLAEVKKRISAGGEVYAVGKVVMIDLVTGTIVPKEEDAAIPMDAKAATVDGFGRILIPHADRVVESKDPKAGTAEFYRNERFCWAITGYKVSIKSGKLEVDPNQPLSW